MLRKIVPDRIEKYREYDKYFMILDWWQNKQQRMEKIREKSSSTGWLEHSKFKKILLAFVVIYIYINLCARFFLSFCEWWKTLSVCEIYISQVLILISVYTFPLVFEYFIFNRSILIFKTIRFHFSFVTFYWFIRNS